MSGGTPLGNMVVKLGLDDADFGRGVENSKKQIRYLTKEMQANTKIADLAGNSLGKMQTRFSSLTEIIRAQEKQVTSLKKAYDESFVDGKATESTKRFATQLQDANGKLANYKQQLINTAGAMAEYQVKNEGLTGAIYKNSERLVSAGDKMASIGGKLTTGLTLPIAGAAIAVGTAAISWESAFAGVKKTNDEVTDSNGKVIYSYKDLEDGLRSLAKELPASHSEIAAVAEAAGQLGIQTENVKSFTKTMIDMGESTNLSAETAATEMARFANIVGMSQDKFSNLGSAIVELGNNYATTEAEISAMSLRLAGAGKQIGMSEGEILGFAAALSSVGVEAEAGGSAFSKVMVQMQLAVEKGGGAFDDLKESAANAGLSWEQVSSAVRNGGKELTNVSGAMGLTSSELKEMVKEADNSAGSLDNFANVAGLTSEQFSKMFKDDPSGAIMKFVEGLSKAEESGSSAIKILDDMDITEVRLRDSLLRAANASGVFSDAVKDGNQAFEENTALTEEASKRYETTESKLKMLKNEVVDIAIDMGGPFVDALRDTVQAGKPVIQFLADGAKAFKDLDPKTQQAIVKVLAFTAAAGPLLTITGKVTGGIGKLGTSFVELAAAMAKKKAIAEITKQMAEGAVSTDTLTTALGGGQKAFGLFGGAAASAAGTGGTGAMMASLSALSPVLLGIVGVGGALAVGYGAWKLFGEEAWNSSQRVKRWGTDVGAETDAVLGKIQTNTQAANGEFALMEQGFSGNTEKMVKNFEQIGVTIENELTGQINAFRESMKLLPEEIQGEAGKIIDGAAEKRQHALETVKANNERILEIKKEYTNKEGEVTAQGAKMIQDLMKQSTQEYLKITVKDADDRKQVMDALTGNVETASAKQAEAWVKNLGKQRQQTKESYSEQLADYKSFLDKQGILHTEEGEKLVKLFEQSRDQSTKAIDAQNALIAKKYPELAEKISFSNGQMINSMDEGNQAFIAANQKIIDKANTLSNRLTENAKKNATQLAWTADEATKAGQIWNGLKLVDKEGNVKTNAAEIVTEATKDVNTWNNMRMVIHDANLDSNAKSVIGEAAIANNWWDGMAWDDKKAILHDEFSAQVVKALEDSGRWAEMSFEEKKAIIYSNTPEVMAETMLNLGLWEQYQPQVKALGADNYQLLNALSFSETALAQYNELDPDFKELIAADPASLTFDQAKKLLDLYNKVPPEMKTLLGDNTNVNAVVAAADKKLRDYDLIRPGPKQLHATADTSAVDTMEREIARIPSYQEKKIAVVYEGRQTGQHAIAAKTGLNYHLGGPMIVNDQKGPLYRELVVRPNGESFIPFGRDVLLPDEPKGTKVYTASQTKRLVPRYAKGTEIPENSKLIKNLRSIESQSKINVNVTSDNSLVESKLDQLIRIMADFGRDLRGMQIIADNKVMANVVTNEQNARNNMIGKLKG